jgi:hypothetical protein
MGVMNNHTNFSSSLVTSSNQTVIGCPGCSCHDGTDIALMFVFAIVSFVAGSVFARGPVNIGDILVIRAFLKKLEGQEQPLFKQMNAAKWYSFRHKQIIGIARHYIEQVKDEEARESLREEYLAAIGWKLWRDPHDERVEYVDACCGLAQILPRFTYEIEAARKERVENV